MALTKEKSKSVRMLKMVYDFIQEREGTSFNQKFEDFVLFYMFEEPRLKERLVALEQQIDEAKFELRSLSIANQKIKSINDRLADISYKLILLNGDCNSLGELLKGDLHGASRSSEIHEEEVY